MRIPLVLALVLAIVSSLPAFAETDSRHAATEELMQFMEARKALEGAQATFQVYVRANAERRDDRRNNER